MLTCLSRYNFSNPIIVAFPIATLRFISLSHLPSFSTSDSRNVKLKTHNRVTKNQKIYYTRISVDYKCLNIFALVGFIKTPATTPFILPQETFLLPKSTNRKLHLIKAKFNVLDDIIYTIGSVTLVLQDDNNDRFRS